MSHLDLLVIWLKGPGADRDRGASLVEYALLVGLIAVVCVVAVQVLGQSTSTAFSSTGTGFTN